MIQELIVAGLLALQDYIALHVLTCLIPAFLLAGGLVAFINKEAILDVLGERASKVKSFSLAMVASFFLAACSCTVIPVSAGLYYSGAAVGVAFIILWVAPSANILCLTYTGSILGGGMVFARVTAALIMASVVGLVMTWFFAKDRSEEKAPAAETSAKPGVIIGRSQLILMFLITLSLLLPNYLIQTGSYMNKVIVWAIVSIIAAGYAWKAISAEEIKSMLRETWWFVKIIFPLLLAGVFLVGVLGKLLPETWIRQWLGGNGVLPSFIATMIGAISYFATMTEAPFVDTLMNLGMGKGPALALLLTGPGLSLPNWIAIARVFSVKMSIVYVVTLVILGTFVGWFYGNFIF